MIDYGKVLMALEKLFVGANLYWQSIILITCFASSYALYRIIRKFFFPKIIAFSLRKNVELNRFLTKYAIPMFYPLLTIVLLWIGMIVYGGIFKNDIMFVVTLKLFALYSFLRFMRISSNSTFIANFVGFFLMPALVLNMFGFLDDIINYLDAIAIKIGEVRISVYLVIKSLVVVMIVFWFSSIATKKSKSYVDGSKKIKLSTKVIISKFIDIFVYCVVGVIILKTVGVDMTTLAVLGGAVGVGIGFGLQKISSNFISGIILLFEKTIEVGDWVEIDNGNILGIVKHFGGRYTLIECFDGKEIMVPNEDFIINRVNNWTYSNNRVRICIDFSVAYNTDLQKAINLAMEVARENPRCLNYPEIECYVTKFAEFDIKMVLFFWVSDITRGRMSVISDTFVGLTRKFKEHGVEIPIPKREIYVRNSNGN